MSLTEIMALALSAKGPKGDRLDLAQLALDGAYAEAMKPQDAFEAWVVERMLRELRSERYQESAEYHYLVAEYQRSL